MAQPQGELAGRILDRLYERKDEAGVSDLVELSRELGVTNPREAGRAAAYLDELGLLSCYMVGRGPSHEGRLSTLGVRLYERFGDGWSLLRRLERVPVVSGETHYHGPVFLGDVGQSNVAFTGPGGPQLVAMGVGTKALLDELDRALRQDASLPEPRRNEAIDDVATARGELEKSRPNWKVVNYLLAGLGAIASVAEHVTKIKAMLGLP